MNIEMLWYNILENKSSLALFCVLTTLIIIKLLGWISTRERIMGALTIIGSTLVGYSSNSVASDYKWVVGACLGAGIGMLLTSLCMWLGSHPESSCDA